jgi:hypothetical protein
VAEREAESSRRGERGVKHRSRLAALLSGWQVGALVVVFALLATLVAVPRPALSDDIPRPAPNARALAAIEAVEHARAKRARAHRLGFAVRALGEAMRAYGAADADGDASLGVRALDSVAVSVSPALEEGQEAVLELRALQTEMFLEALRGFERTGVESGELRELGGGFVALARRARWLARRGAGYAFAGGPAVREVLFKKRWNEVTGLKAPAFALALEEQRAFYAFVLEHPMATVPPGRSTGVLARCRAANEFLLRRVVELGQIDRDYPADYAQGLLLVRLGRPREAVEPLARHLDRHPDGPHTLRVRNALRAAQEQLIEVGSL